MLFFLVAWCLALLAGCVTAQANNFLPSVLERQAAPLTNHCNTTCTTYRELEANCITPHCGCNVPFIQSQGDCMVCQISTPQEAAAVQFFLDAEMGQCLSEGFNVELQLDLSPAAAAIVRKFNRDSASLRRSQNAFFALQVSGGHIGLVIVLAFAVFSRKVRRDPTFLSFCITWVFSSIVFSIFLYQGTGGNNMANPLGFVPPDQCLAQAALTAGAQVMTACSTLALVIQLWLSLRAAIYGVTPGGSKHTKWTRCALLFTPYLLFIGFALPCVFVGMDHVVVKGAIMQSVIPTNFYCAMIKLNPFQQFVYGVTLALLLMTVIFDVLVMSVLYRHWWALRHLETKSAVSLSILLRVMMFSIYYVVVVVAYGTVVIQPPSVYSPAQGGSLAIFFSIPIWVDLLQATIPLVGFLVLGINKEIISSLTFWRRLQHPRIATATTISNGRFSTMNTPRSSTVNSMSSSMMDSVWDEKAILEAEIKFISVPI